MRVISILLECFSHAFNFWKTSQISKRFQWKLQKHNYELNHYYCTNTHSSLWGSRSDFMIWRSLWTERTRQHRSICSLFKWPWLKNSTSPHEVSSGRNCVLSSASRVVFLKLRLLRSSEVEVFVLHKQSWGYQSLISSSSMSPLLESFLEGWRVKKKGGRWTKDKKRKRKPNDEKRDDRARGWRHKSCQGDKSWGPELRRAWCLEDPDSPDPPFTQSSELMCFRTLRGRLHSGAASSVFRGLAEPASLVMCAKICL